jgi:tetrahydromethanopterin S-methyltransferase subunit C
MIVANFFIGLVFVAIGVAMLHFNFQLTNSFSKNNVFERKLGAGSSYLVFQVVAILVVVWGTLQTFSLHDNLTSWALSPVRDFFDRTGF